MTHTQVELEWGGWLATGWWRVHHVDRFKHWSWWCAGLLHTPTAVYSWLYQSM